MLDSGPPLSPAEDLETALLAARQAEALGRKAMWIRRGDETVLVGDKLEQAISQLQSTLGAL
jgi:hypothetical protein